MAAPTSNRPTTTIDSLALSDRPPDEPDLGLVVVLVAGLLSAGAVTDELGATDDVDVGSVVEVTGAVVVVVDGRAVVEVGRTRVVGGTVVGGAVVVGAKVVVVVGAAVVVVVASVVVVVLSPPTCAGAFAARAVAPCAPIRAVSARAKAAAATRIRTSTRLALDISLPRPVTQDWREATGAPPDQAVAGCPTKPGVSKSKPPARPGSVQE